MPWSCLLRRLAVLLMPALLAACAADIHPSTMRPGVVVATCADKAQCELYWQRTREWIARNSRRPVNNATDWMLETASPGTFDASLTFHIIRWPGPKDSGEIRFEAYCSTVLPCIPSTHQAFEELKGFIANS